MSTPYYADDLVQLFHGDCREILPDITPGTVDALIADPPYFNVKDEDWDRQWRKRDDFLSWLGGILDQTKPLLAPHASAWVFASPFMARGVEDQVGKRFRVLNSIRWWKPDSTHNRAEIAKLRRYATAWEAIVFAEQFADAYGDQAKALHAQVFAPIGRYIASERERAGFTRKELAMQLNGYKNLDSATANVWNWELGKNLVNAIDYEVMRSTLGVGFLEREYEDLPREYEDLRRPFLLVRSAGPVTDLWNFPQVESYPGKHPCEKPLAMLRHMLNVSTRPGSLVLDPFAGSGSTLRAAKQSGRRAIGIEIDERYCEHAASRLSQGLLFFEEEAS